MPTKKVRSREQMRLLQNVFENASSKTAVAVKYGNTL
jgi:hypothetical protein